MIFILHFDFLRTKTAQFYHIIAQKAANIPFFIMKNVEDISIQQPKDVKDNYIKIAASKEL